MSTVDTVERTLRSRMLRGEIPPGARLRQDQLASELGVSKIPVREALQRMTAAGLLQFQSNRGALVPSLTAEDATENYSLRRAVEPLLLQQAIHRLTVVDLAEAEMALQGSGMPIPESNWMFHQALYRASGWDRGLAVAEMLHTAVAPYVRLYTEGLKAGAESDMEHRRLLDACSAGNAPAALEILTEHLNHAEAALTLFLSAESD